MVKTLKRTSKKSYRTLLHRRKINNKLRSKKNGVSKRYSKKAVLKQKGGVTQESPIKVYIVYQKGKHKDTNGEFTTLPNTYNHKLEFVEQMSKLDVGNIIGILYQKDEHDWVFSGLNYEYEESVIVGRSFNDTQEDLDEKLRQHNNADIPPYKMKLEKSKSDSVVDNSKAIKKAITQLCGNHNLPESFFTQMYNHSLCIRLQKKGMITYRIQGEGTHQLTSTLYTREEDTYTQTTESQDPSDIWAEERTVNKRIRGKLIIGKPQKILITPVKDVGIKMVVDSSKDITVEDGDIIFMPYVSPSNYDDYCSDEMRTKENKYGKMCDNYGMLPRNIHEYNTEFPGRPMNDEGPYTYGRHGSINVTSDFLSGPIHEVNNHMISRLIEFCNFIIVSKAIQLKTAYVKKKLITNGWTEQQIALKYKV